MSEYELKVCIWSQCLSTNHSTFSIYRNSKSCELQLGERKKKIRMGGEKNIIKTFPAKDDMQIYTRRNMYSSSTVHIFWQHLKRQDLLSSYKIWFINYFYLICRNSEGINLTSFFQKRNKLERWIWLKWKSSCRKEL